MKRTIAAVAVTLGLVACGGGDDDTTADEPGTEEPAAEEPAADEEPTAEEPAAEEPAAEEPAADEEPTAEEPAAEEPADDSGGASIESLDDIPEECRDLMADFLRDVEPIVEPVDWENATLTDFEQVAADFEERANEFDTASGSEGCDDLDFADDDGFELVVDFARDVAPGTVGFFEFLDTMRTGVIPGDDEGDASGALEDCDDVIAGLEQLMADYDAFSEVPVNELARYANMASAMMSCTPEQLQALESAEMNDFLSR